VTRDQASKIQILSAKHEGLLLVVDRMFDKFATLQEVQEMIERKYHEKISETAVSTYKKKHWKVQKDKVRDQKTTMKAIAEIIGEDGLDAGVTALLWQALQTMTPPQLIALKKVLNDDKKVELVKQQFALYAQAHRQKMEERSSMKAGKGRAPAEEGVEDFDAAQRVVERVKEIFGIGTASIETPTQRLLAPPEELPSPVAPAAAGKENA
jgi:hypoxanthine phosphoribosyltransferase